MYNILEVANTHGGNLDYMFELIKEFEEFNKVDSFGMKFQPFKYDNLATKDFEWYPVYVELFFNEKEWKLIIDEAYKTKDIWIDLFEKYGLKIIENNMEKIHGIKLQTSVLDNEEVFQGLQKIELSQMKLIINIAGRTKENIDFQIKKFSALGANELLIEVGFQSFPTALEDSGFAKIKYLQDKYINKIVFADHIDGVDPDAITLPLLAVMNNVEYLEKHIMHSKLDTKYDHFSSLKYTQYKKIIESQKKFIPLLTQPFINKAEEAYFKNTYQTPILNTAKKKYQLIDISKDLDFKRSNITGLNSEEIKSLVDNYYILNSEKNIGDGLQKEDFKKANIAGIIACRLKSTRLPRKAILDIDGIPSIELCIKNTLRIDNLNHVILATSDNKQDSELSAYTYNESVIFHQGDAEDVIQRYIDIIDQLKIDIVVRITGDMPYVSSEITEYLLKSHFKNGADFTVAKNVSVGTGVEIINVSALKKVKLHFPKANYSEYMSWYFHNNPEHFKLNFVDLPPKWIRKYRLTLDYKEDLELFIKIEKHLKRNKLVFTIKNVFDYLDENPKIANVNLELIVKYKTDKKLIDTLNEVTKIK